MNKFLFGLFLICAGSIAGLSLLMADDRTPSISSPTVEVGVESGKVAVIDTDQQKNILQAGQNAISNNTGTTVSTSPLTKATDVPKAITATSSAEYEPVKEIPTQTIALASEPPSSKTETPQTVEATPPEYRCSFEIIVNSKKEADGDPAPIKPIPGVDVILWKGLDIPRPIVDTIQLPLFVFDKGTIPAVLTLKNDGIYVSNYPTKGAPSKEEPYVGDRLIGLDGYTYLPDASLTNSAAHIYLPTVEQDHQLLRIWDTLTAYSRMSFSETMEGFLEFKHNGQVENIVSHLCNVVKSHPDEIVAQGTTDSQGRCLFENLPAGIYYAQARKGNQRSFIAILSPARRGVKMWLGYPELMVMVEKNGVDVIQLKGIHGAQVQLESIGESGKGLYSETTERMGIARFKNLPWGSYRVTVTPPPDIAKPPQTTTINFEELYQRAHVKFDTPEQNHELAGKVLRKDTNEPVKDFALELVMKARLDGEQIYGVKGVKTKTSEDGSFQFGNVQSGNYELVSGNSNDYNGFLAVGETLLPSDGGWSDGGEEIRVDRDIADYKLLVLPGVETKFSGQALKTDGSPATGASIQLEQTVVRKRDGQTMELQRQVPTLPSNPKTDKDGKFAFSFITTADSEIHKGIIHAAIQKNVANDTQGGMSGTGSSGGYGMMMGGMGGRGMQPGTPLAEVNYPIEYKLGDAKTGLQIVLQDIIPYVIEGKLTSEDGGLPDGLQICTYFQNQFYYAKIDRQGNYQLEVPKAGKVELQIAGSSSSGLIPGQTDKYGSLSYFKYCCEFPTVEVSDENRTVRLDVNFQKGYFLLGRVLDQNKNPIKDAWIEAFSPATVDPSKEKTDSYNCSQTNEQGYFSIPGLRRNLEHRLIVRTKLGGDILAQMDGVMPEPEIGDHVILIVIDKSKTLQK